MAELELEPLTGKKDTRWRSTEYRQRANELNYFWELAKEQLPSNASPMSKKEMCTAAEELQKHLGVKSVAQQKLLVINFSLLSAALAERKA